ncbi:MAG: transposase [Pseudomonadota bacterium]
MLNSDGKTGSRKGRLNYEAGFKLQLAKAACEAGVSIARLALEHGLNANMVHKWRRQYLAGLAVHAPPASAQFLPVTMTGVEPAVAHEQVRISPIRAPKQMMPTQPSPINGTIDIKFGGATVRIDGVVDASVLAAVLSHFHP